ncbi:hypothetical protein MLD38_039185 [Melastoma candidum]|uniref:Uncharacterized protein n=1 Tax=Melastoma candidum TaxID=119954 RepID=A0ACB9L257_9MYRT|nr:hypothetical protein MLD38_039185 [Melastoma candidum]
MVSCFRSVILSVFVLALSSAAVAEDLVEKVCQRDPDYQFCLTTLRSNRGTADADRYTLAALAFQMAFADAKGGLDYIDSLLKNSSVTPIVRGRLQQCRGDYDNATLKYIQAGNDINSETYDTLGGYATDAGKDADDCKSAFEGKASPVDDNNRNLKGYSQIGIAVASLFT